MSNKKYINDVLAGNNNGGLDSLRGFATLQQVMTTHDLKQPVVYQFILTGSTKEEYQATMKALMRHIRTKCRAEYVGAYEVGEEKNGLHCHMFALIETAKHFPADLLDVSEGKFIARRVKRKAKEAKEAGLDKSLSIRIEPPKNPMHGGQMFARMNTPAKLADCIKWASYYLKTRSKADVPGRETYFGSEFASNIAKRETQRQVYRDALTKSTKNEQATSANDINDSGEEMMNNELTPAAYNYLAGCYEKAVDQRMNVLEIQGFLRGRGINKSLSMIRRDLDETFQFYRYAEQHPAPPIESFAVIDSQLFKVRPARKHGSQGMPQSANRIQQ